MKKTDAIVRARTDFGTFVACVSPPHFVFSRHHRAMIPFLAKVESGEIDRGNLNTPPRHTKSTQLVQLVAFALGRHPEWNIIYTTYSADLSTDFGRQLRMILESPIYRAIFPGTVLAADAQAAQRLATTKGGAAFFVSTGGVLTGRGGDLIIADDIVKGWGEAISAAERRSVQQWFRGVLYPRLESGGRMIICGTRWSQGDFIDWVLRENAADNWQTLSLCALADENDPLGREPGEALWPEKFPRDALLRIRETIGVQAFSALYQQAPIPTGGTIFKTEWFPAYQELPQLRQSIMAVDCASKLGEGNDYSAVVIIGEGQNGYYVTYAGRWRLEFPDLRRKLEALFEAWRPTSVVIEDASAGIALIQALQKETRLPIVPVKATGPKISRAIGITGTCEAQRVHLPADAVWLPDLLGELAAFPGGAHDDLLDCFVYAITYLRDRTSGRVDLAFQAQASAVFREQTAARQRGFDDVSSDSSDRAYGRQPYVSQREDRVQTLARFSHRKRWAGF
jgi:predicted phage terminase large subunit-like protein